MQSTTAPVETAQIKNGSHKPRINISSHLARMNRLNRHIIISCKKTDRTRWPIYENSGLLGYYANSLWSELNLNIDVDGET